MAFLKYRRAVKSDFRDWAGTCAKTKKKKKKVTLNLIDTCDDVEMLTVISDA